MRLDTGLQGYGKNPWPYFSAEKYTGVAAGDGSLCQYCACSRTNEMRTMIISLLVSIMFSAGIWNDAHMHRQGLLLVEVAAVTITEDEGGGRLGGYDDAKGWYSSYRVADGFALGDKALSIYVYNPFSNDIDDVIWRYDRLFAMP